MRFGRKPKLSDYQRAEALKRRNAGETLADIARLFDDVATVSDITIAWDTVG